MGTSNLERREIYIGDSITSSMSFCGCLFIILMHVLFKDLRGYSFRLIIVLSIFDLLNSIGFLLPSYDSSDKSFMCQLQAITINISTLAGILWTSVIAFNIHCLITNASFKVKNYFKWQLLAVVSISIIAGIVPEYTKSYGRTAGWCWIVLDNQHYNTEFFLRLAFLFIPWFCALIFNVLIYIKLMKRLKNVDVDCISQQEKKFFLNKIMIYPVILVVCYSPYCVKQVIEMTGVNDSDYLFQLTIVAGIARSSHGFFNSVVYGLTKRVRLQIRNVFYKVLRKDTQEISIYSPVKTKA